jgi:hypothetical protein
MWRLSKPRKMRHPDTLSWHALPKFVTHEIMSKMNEYLKPISLDGILWKSTYWEHLVKMRLVTKLG